MRRSRRARPRPRVLLAPRRTRGTDAFSFPAGGCCLCPGGRVVPLLFGGRRRRGPPVGAHEAGVRWLMAPPTSHLLSSLGDEGRDRGRELCVAAHGRHRPTAHRPPPPLWLHGRLAACRPCLVAGKDGGGGGGRRDQAPPACTAGRATRWRHWEAHVGRGAVRRLPFRAALLLPLMAGGDDHLRAAAASPSPPTWLNPPVLTVV